MPLLQSIAGPHFPKMHTQRYIQRSEGNASPSPPLTESDLENANHSATVLVGTQADFEYDAIGKLIFDNEAAFQAFFALISQGDAAESISKDEEMFLDRPRLRVVVVDDCVVTTRATTSG